MSTEVKQGFEGLLVLLGNPVKCLGLTDLQCFFGIGGIGLSTDWIVLSSHDTGGVGKTDPPEPSCSAYI